MARSTHRILFCEVCNDGTTGGSHQALFETIRGLDRERFEPSVVFYEENRYVAMLRELGLRVHVWAQEHRKETEPHVRGPLTGKFGAVVGAVLRRVQVIRKEEIDLVHLNNSPIVGCDDWIPAAWLGGIPCITWTMGPGGPVPGGPLRRRLALRFARIIAISDHVADRLRAGGYPERMLRTVHLGIDIEAFRARVERTREEVRAELGVSPETMLVSFVGNLREWKGHRVVLTALESLEAAQRSRLHVLFIGAVSTDDVQYEASLRQRVKNSGLESCVSFLGSRLDVPDLTNAADVALHASIEPEPFGLVLVEGMCLGKPMVAAQLGGPLEIVTPESGILFDPERPDQLQDALLRLLEDPELRLSLGEGARRRSEDFTARRMVEGVEAIYEELIG